MKDFPASLFTTLHERRLAEGLNGAAFARKLGLSQSYWWEISHGVKPITPRAALSIIGVYEDLRGAVMEVLQTAEKKREPAA